MAVRYQAPSAFLNQDTGEVDSNWLSFAACCSEGFENDRNCPSISPGVQKIWKADDRPTFTMLLIFWTSNVVCLRFECIIFLTPWKSLLPFLSVLVNHGCMLTNAFSVPNR